ncbi:MAG: hypothetical protein RIQ37_630 [Actinomycetota bacterium]
MSVFLDHASTTPVRPQVKELLATLWEQTGNPSSVHTQGQKSRAILEEARERLAKTLNCHPSEVIFLSGGTEACNMAIKGIYWQQKAQDPRKNFIISAYTEHHAVIDTLEWLAQHQGAEIIWLEVSKTGEINLEQLAQLVETRGEEIALIALMWANNETGVVTEIPKVTQIAGKIPVFSDAVAAMGHIPVDFKASGLSAMAISGHKIGAPIGVGALIISRNLKPESLIHGGGQERGLRSGTMNYPMALGLAQASELASAELTARHERLAELRDTFERRLKELFPEVIFTTQAANRLADNSHMLFPGCTSDSLLFLLDQEGIAVSAGSACQAGVVGPSHVVLNMGYDEKLASAPLRVTLGWNTTEADLDALLKVLPGAYEKAKQAHKTR